MKFAVAALTFAAGAIASSLEPSFATEDVSYTTLTVTAITTYCPEPTEITMGETTYTVTEVRRFTDCEQRAAVGTGRERLSWGREMGWTASDEAGAS